MNQVAKMGGLCLKYTSPTLTGFPDRLILLPGGRAAWAELKSEGETPRPMQRVRIARLRRLGFRVGVCDTRKAVDQFLASLTV